MNSDVWDTIEAALERCLSDSWFLDEAQGDVARHDIKVALAEVRRQREAETQPNWDDAPMGTKYWCMDRDGEAWWSNVEMTPNEEDGQWLPPETGFVNCVRDWGYKVAPATFGVDWRATLRRRTQAGRQDGE